MSACPCVLKKRIQTKSTKRLVYRHYLVNVVSYRICKMVFLYLGLGHEGMGALLPDCVRRHRGQHAHDSGQPQEPRDVLSLL
jgi:hypothetical protein